MGIIGHIAIAMINLDQVTVAGRPTCVNDHTIIGRIDGISKIACIIQPNMRRISRIMERPAGNRVRACGQHEPPIGARPADPDVTTETVTVISRGDPGLHRWWRRFPIKVLSDTIRDDQSLTYFKSITGL
jgi:hypothetical protein